MSDQQTPETALLVKELREEAAFDDGRPWPYVLLLTRAADAIEKLQAAANQERARLQACAFAAGWDACLAFVTAYTSNTGACANAYGDYLIASEATPPVQPTEPQ